MKKRLSAFFCSLLFSGAAFAVPTEVNWQIVNPEFEQTETVVAGFVVGPGDFNNQNDMTAETQQMLDALNRCGGDDGSYAHGGGVLYFKKGHYKFRGNLLVPKGVTIRGDWKKPEKGKSLDYGTVFEVYTGRNQYGANNNGDDVQQGNSFIQLHSGASVNGITFWYPEQNAENPVPYSHTILLGRGFGWSAEFNFVRNVTFVNSYSGIYYQDAGGTCPNVNGVYGTPMVRAVEIDHIVDVGHIDNVDISPDYWEGSGFAGSPSKNNAQFRTWLKNNGVGIIMRRNDWSYTCYISVDGYNKGFYSAKSKGTDAATPNGHNYGLTFKNCRYGLYHDGRMGEGVMFTEVNVENCDYGCYVSDQTGGVLQLLKWNFANQSDKQYDLYVDSKSSTKINMQQSTFGGGRVVVNGGALATAGCAFNNAAPQVEVEANGRVVLLGSKWANAQAVSQKSIYENIIDDTQLANLPAFAYEQFVDKTTKPSGIAFEVVDSPRGNKDNIPNEDATPTINAALQRVKNSGGGVVYLVPGHYRINGQIEIPSGVELKGSTDIGTFPLGPGSYLDVYNMNTPAVLMQENSILRGVHFDYPTQVRCTDIPNNVKDFPFTIKGNGDNICIVNVGTRCSNRGVDMDGCNNFYINYLTGYFFREGVNVKNSRGGIIANMQCNTQVYNNGYEDKYGKFPNSKSEGCPETTDPYLFNSKNLDFLTMEDTHDILLYNNFNYNTLNGIIFKNNVSGKALGFALDDDRTGLLLDGNNIDFDFINLQCVSLDRGPDGNPSGDPKKASYITATPNYGGNSKVNIFSSDWWGGSVSATGGVTMENGAQGTINLYQSNFMQFGSCQNAFNVNGGTLNVYNSTIASPNNNLVSQSGNGKVNIVGSFTNVTGNPATNVANTASGTFSSAAATPRTGWIASASYTNDGSASNAIDGNNGSQWTSGWQNQGDGQGEVWFQIDMQQQNTFNQVVYDNSGAPNDGPQTYIFQVSDDGANWETKAQGNGGGSMTIIELPEPVTARYFRIVKPASTKGNFWAIYEVNIFNMETTGEGKPDPDPEPEKPASELTPYNGQPANIPGRIEAEEYDNGGEGVAYHDNNAAYEGNAGYRTEEGVDIGNGGTGRVIGWTGGGEWTKYTVNVEKAGKYTLRYNVASQENGNGSFSIDFDGTDKTGTLAAASTGWDNYNELTAPNQIELTAGRHVMTFLCNGGMNIDYFEFVLVEESETEKPSGTTPFNGPHIIKDGVILQAEDFDNGGEGVAYHDQEPGHHNQGQAIAYRTDVDVEIESYNAGEYSIGFTNNGEWLLYTVEVEEAGTYTIHTTYASGGNGGFTFAVDGEWLDAQNTQTTDTGGWSTWTDVATPGVVLPAGTHQLKWYTFGGQNIDKFSFERTGDVQQGGGDGSAPRTMEMYNPLFVEFGSPMYTGPGRTGMYTADPSAHVFGDRLYVYASHDMEPAVGCDRMDRYHIFSTDDMKNWTDHGEIFGSGDVAWGRPEGGFMWAPDCAYNPANETYYYYFPHASDTDWNNSWKVGIATSKDPATGFTVGGYIEGLESLIDPCVFVDDDGQPYIIHGGGGRCMMGKLDKNDWTRLDGQMQVVEGLNDFHEGAWLHKYNGKYYLSYADNHGTDGNQLKYAMADTPFGPWESKGAFLYATGCDTSHGSIVQYKGKWYAFYHTSNASGQYNLRSVCFDELLYNDDGTIQVVKNWGEPFNGRPHNVKTSDNTTEILCNVEAEDFNTKSHYGYWDKDVENKGNSNYRRDERVDVYENNGRTYVGNTQPGEWLRYTIDVAESGLYDIDCILNGVGNNPRFHISVNGTDKTGQLTAPAGWQTLTAKNIAFKAGEQYIDVRIDGEIEFDKFQFRKSAPYSGTPYKKHDIKDGAEVEAEDFDKGGAGVAYFDNDPENRSNSDYRQGEGVDLEDSNGSIHISWTGSGEWTKYTLNVVEAGVYDIDVRVSTGNGAGSLSLTFDDVDEYGPVSINSGSWNDYVDLTIPGVTLAEGKSIMQMTIGGNINVDKYTFRKKEEEKVDVDKVSISGVPAEMTEGQTATISVKIEPENATNKDITWAKSENISVTKNPDGTFTLTATAAGEATVKATVDGKESGEVKFTVKAKEVAVEKVAIENKETLEKTDAIVGEEITVTATVSPDNATDKTITWTVTNAEFTDNGNGSVTVKFNATGKVTVTAKSGNESDNVTINVRNPKVTGITISGTTNSAVVGETISLTAKVEAEEDADKTVTWTSNNPNIAVDKDGKVTATAAGEATITAKAGDETATYKVTFSAAEKPVTSFSIAASKTEVQKDDEVTFTLSAIQPTDATNKGDVTFSITEGNNLGRIDGNVLKITADAYGSIVVSAKIGDVNSTNTVEITVKAKVVAVEEIVIQNAPVGMTVDEKVTVTVVIKPDNATNKDFTLATSSNLSFVENNDGSFTVTANRSGDAFIQVTAGGKTTMAKFYVNAKPVVNGVTLSETNHELLKGESFVLSATVSADEGVDQSVTWTSSDPSIASVDEYGNVTAHKGGSVTVKATSNADSKYFSSCKVNVIAPVTGVTIEASATEVAVGETVTFSASLKPEDATNDKVKYSIESGQKFGSLVGNTLTTKGAGEIVVLVTTDDGKFTDRITIVVKEEVGTGIDDVAASAGKSIENFGNTVVVSGLEVGETVSVFSILGVHELSVTAKGSVERFTLPAGLHIVRIDKCRMVRKVFVAH